MDIRQSSLTGAAGEHLVMSRLLSRGYIAALAPQGVLNFDIVVTSRDGEHQCALQVKTSWAKGVDRGWHMQEKHEQLISPGIFYAFVDLGAGEAPRGVAHHPDVYVVPSDVVAKAIRTSYAKWLSSPGKKQQQRQPTKLRRLNFDYTSMCGPGFPFEPGWLRDYLERWDLISGQTHAAPPADLG